MKRSGANQRKRVYVTNALAFVFLELERFSDVVINLMRFRVDANDIVHFRRASLAETSKMTNETAFANNFRLPLAAAI
jgi:hypothetical protein